MIECISYFVHYIQGCWRHILFIFLTWTVLDSASCALWKIFFQKDIHKYIQTNEIMTPDMVQVRTWPIFVGDQAMRTYGNFEGFPYNSALFRLAISWPLWYRNDIQQNLRWCSKSAVASAWRLLLVPPTFLDLHDVENPRIFLVQMVWSFLHFDFCCLLWPEKKHPWMFVVWNLRISLTSEKIAWKYHQKSKAPTQTTIHIVMYVNV